MPGLGTLTLIGAVALVVLVFFFLKVRRQDLLAEVIAKRAKSSKLVSRADYVEGAERIPVAISLTADTLIYENPDLDASFDLNRIDEVEYAGELVTGKTIEANSKILRLRSHGTTFEFMLPQEDAAKWVAALPPRILGPQKSARAS